jgi:uncharacterized membrane protein
MDPGELWPLKLIFLCADLATLLLLFRLLDRKSYIVIYAWSPLLIKEISFSAHSDILALCLLMAAIATFAVRKPVLASALLALAAGARLTALLFAPFLLPASRGKDRIRSWLIFAATLFLVYMPFAVRGGVESKGWACFSSSGNSTVPFAILQWALGDEAGRVVSVALFAGAFFRKYV